MSIKYEPPQNIKFSYTDEETQENFDIEYNKEDNSIIIVEKDDSFKFPLLLFTEITDFLRNNRLLNKTKNKEVETVNTFQDQNVSQLPLPDIVNDEGNSVVKMPDIITAEMSSIDSIVSFSPDVILSGAEQKGKEDLKITETKEEISKRPVLDGNMTSEQASAIRGKGQGAERSEIKRA